ARPSAPRTRIESSDLSRLRRRKLVRGAPGFDPGHHFFSRYCFAGPLELAQTTEVFFDIGAFDVNHGIEQRNGIGDDRRCLLAAFSRQLAQARVGCGVKIENATNGIHQRILRAAGSIVEEAPELPRPRRMPERPQKYVARMSAATCGVMS